ncbi:hypothetical protein F1Z33_15305 [Staphylococcus aureus]|uniref:Uncharacterized protein n=1 Tax=Staphylococcus aureus TaxID=1280 RepID=E4PXS3_STAAU|nr:hypothetical protein SUD_0007p2 [Staphylococcus aureus]ADM29203.1 hypothetical protein SUP_0007 [Staphylococcus aureus]KAA0457609.1 hypothetical protein FQP72_13745 [Staphylococcus aureus]MBD6612898.1 hypothetical protein [Staphylococcus aureus]MBD6624177.1 hypothetical protein [Staphylococcus aureus]
MIKTPYRNLEKRGEVLKNFMLIFNLHVNGQCLKIVIVFAQIFVFENSIYLFGSYLRFKSIYKF